jgi:outer membrane lipoprotein LolB
MKMIKQIICTSILILAACNLANAQNTVPLETKKSKYGKSSKRTNNKISTKASHISSFALNGAMAVRSQRKSWTASVNWIQRGAGNFNIRLSGPIGSGTILINKQGGSVSYRDGSRTASSSNANQLLYKETGVRLPVNNLFYWVRGIPTPGAVQSAQKDQSGRLQVLRQSGYTIVYGNYTSIGDTALPTQIRLEGNGVLIKMAIKRWKI